MSENRLRLFDPHRFQHDRPVYGVGGQNVFADQMTAYGPPFLELFVVLAVADAGNIVDQCVKPDITDVVAVERQFDSPGEAGFRTRDAEVAERLVQEAERFIGPEQRHDEKRMGLDVVDQPVLILAHPEKIVGFGDFVGLAAALGTEGVPVQVLFLEETFAGHTVTPFVFVLVDFAAVVQVLQDFLHHFFMERHGGADEIIVGNIEGLPEFLETQHGGVALFLGRDADLFGGLLDFLPVFVGAGQEKRRHALFAMIAGQYVAEHGGVGMADVRLVIDVIDRGGDVIFVRQFQEFFKIFDFAHGRPSLLCSEKIVIL